MADYIPSLERDLYQFMQQTSYRPMKHHELIRALKIPSDRRREVRQTLKHMEEKGRITRLRKNRWALPNEQHVITGELSVHVDGYGFVAPDTREQPDIFIPSKAMGVALHGDRVQVALTGSRARRRGGRRGGATENATAQSSGKIMRVLERKYGMIAGVYKVTPHYAYVIPDNPRIQQNVRVSSKTASVRSVQDNHRVVIELRPWDAPDQPLPGRIVEDLGPADAPGADMAGLLRSHGLEQSFPSSVEKASRSIRSCGDSYNEKQRRDLRDELLFTIDPEDARDFDDAVSLTRPGGRHWVLSVHIADVAAYVPPDSPIDKEARSRGNSVYLVDRVINMLPRHLTEEVCSLSPHTDRFAHTIRMTVSSRGKVLDYETFPSLIRSSTRLNYDQVQVWLKNGQADGVEPAVGSMLDDMHRLSDVLRRKRARGGSILFEMPEVRCVLNEQGETTNIVPRTAYAAYHLIEEFMLLANQTVARHITGKGFPTIYRVHDAPDEEQWERMVVDLRALGIDAPVATRDDLNAIAESVAGEPVAHIVNLAMLRNLKRAVYSAERAEHFGLAFTHYLHFTSPIRRYSDLIVHRVLKAMERGEPAPYSCEEMKSIADHISQTEREADEAEQESVHLKRIEYFAAKLDAGDTGPYQALITSMNRRGVLVELVDTLQQGLVPFALMANDHYRINDHRNRAVGRHTRHTLKIGDVLDVELVRVDKARKRIDFRPADEPPPSKRTTKKKKS